MRTRITLIAVALISLCTGLVLTRLHAEPVVLGADGIGRYQLVRINDQIGLMVDTKTGRTWQRLISTNLKVGEWQEMSIEELGGHAK